MICRAAARDRVQSAKRDLEAIPEVHDPHLQPPERGTRPRWTLHALVLGTDGLPARVLTPIVENGLTLHQQPPQADAEVIVATA